MASPTRPGARACDLHRGDPRALVLLLVGTCPTSLTGGSAIHVTRSGALAPQGKALVNTPVCHPPSAVPDAGAESLERLPDGCSA